MNCMISALPVKRLGFWCGPLCISLLALGAAGCKPKPPETAPPAPPAPSPASAASVVLPEVLRPFLRRQEQLARQFAQRKGVAYPADLGQFFTAGIAGDWDAARRAFGQFDRQYRSAGGAPGAETVVFWQLAIENVSACQQFLEGNAALLEIFGREILQSVPTNSIYFGGTAPGRFVVSALSESHQGGRPFFTLTQNQLADAQYLYYLQEIYGEQLSVPTMEEAKQNFDAYVLEAKERLERNQLKAEEEVRVLPDGRTQVSGPGAVKAITAGLVKLLVAKNPGHRAFIEQSFPLEPTLPHLAPAGPVLEFHREPLPALPAETLDQDREYWTKLTATLIGDAVAAQTSIASLCQFADRVYRQGDRSDFRGNPAYAADENAQAAFGKLRLSIASLYQWRWQQAPDQATKEKLRTAADLAFRQAFALCPFHPEGAQAFHQYLAETGRAEEAKLIRETAVKFTPKDPELAQQLRQLK